MLYDYVVACPLFLIVLLFFLFLFYFFFFLMIRRPPRSTLFPTRRSSDLRRPLPIHAERIVRPRDGRTRLPRFQGRTTAQDRKSTRLNSSHVSISYAVFCLKKKKKHDIATLETHNLVIELRHPRQPSDHSL